jgi:CRISPR/Cas system-associated endonuclease Cas1
MEEVIDLIATDASPSDISDKIKEVLFAKSSEKIENVRPNIANSMFNTIDNFDSQEEEE